MRFLVPAIRGLGKPSKPVEGIARDAFSLQIHQTQIVLRSRMSRVCSKLIAANTFRRIFRDEMTIAALLAIAYA